mgnify:FL=1
MKNNTNVKTPNTAPLYFSSDIGSIIYYGATRGTVESTEFSKKLSTIYINMLNYEK